MKNLSYLINYISSDSYGFTKSEIINLTSDISYDEFIKSFTEEYKREPSEDDIVDNFVNDPDNEIDDKIMLEYFKKYLYPSY